MDILQNLITPRIRRFILIVWSLGFVLLIAGMTDFFSQSPFQKKFILAWLLILFSLKAFFDFRNKTAKNHTR
jgi:hypothetical protein